MKDDHYFNSLIFEYGGVTPLLATPRASGVFRVAAGQVAGRGSDRGQVGGRGAELGQISGRGSQRGDAS